MLKLKSLLTVLIAAAFTSPAFAAAVEYADSADLSATLSGITTIAVAVGGAGIILALTRMFYRKLKGVSRG